MLASVNRGLLVVAVGAGAGAVLLVLGLSRRILGPVETLTKAATKMAAGSLDQRVDIASDDEIGELGQAFNQMAAGLSRQEELRRNMVTDVAHELRTPLTNIRGYLQAISDGVLEPEPEVVELLCDEAELLGDLVDDLQELSLAEAGQVVLDRQLADLGSLTTQASSAFASRAEAKGVSLTTHVPPCPVLAHVDPRRIGQVMRNVLENALIHTPPGGRIAATAQSVRRDGLDEPADALEISVTDTGGGIAPDDLPHVFDRFYRADRSRSRATGGAGLGLAIANQIVEAHGGHIGVESKVGSGTTFSITLPLVSTNED
jgi:signal transduction histidine kinase